MNMGVQEGQMFSWLHEDAEKWYSRCMCIKTVCQWLHNPGTMPPTDQMLLNVPFEPMLARYTGSEKTTDECLKHVLDHANVEHFTSEPKFVGFSTRQ
jgi:hypothetical protein